jgi:hypothetical protein
MGAVEIQRMMRSRVLMLTSVNPDLEIEDSMNDGDWGLLTLRERGNLVGFEFLESKDSWKRPDALLQYFEASNDGYYVGVIVPDESIEDVTDMIFSMGEDPVVILSYEGLGITPFRLA